jgi:beta-lactamase superfamily II metal-dependent hydrolase
VKIYQLKPTTPTRIQMMAYIFVTDEGEIAIMDGGNWGDGPHLYRVLQALSGGKKPQIKAWLSTHAHSDHVDAFRWLMEHHAGDIRVERVYYHFPRQDYLDRYDPENAHTCREMMKTLEKLGEDTCVQVQAGQRIALGSGWFTVLQVPDEVPTVNVINNASVVYRMSWDHYSVLFLGDLGKEGGERLLQCYKDKLESTVVQMAHHGQNGVGREVYAAVRPKLCFWPTPEWLWNNDPGSGYNTGTWKTLEVRGWMKQLGDPPAIIEKDGDWMLELTPQGMDGQKVCFTDE